MRNVEIKAKVQNLQNFLKRAEEISKKTPTLIVQNDTFFKAERGRLKLRQFESGNGELIYYERQDAEGPKLSDYEKYDVKESEFNGLKNILNRALGITGNVKKRRQLFMVGNTRVHADSVEGLGDFMELEVCLKDNQTVEEGDKIAKNLMQQLGVNDEDLISGAYTDLLNKK